MYAVAFGFGLGGLKPGVRLLRHGGCWRLFPCRLRTRRPRCLAMSGGRWRRPCAWVGTLAIASRRARHWSIDDRPIIVGRPIHHGAVIVWRRRDEIDLRR